MAKSSRLRLPTILPFLVVLLFFLYLANLVVYDALVIIFALSVSGELVALAVMLGALTVSFIAATILGMRYDNAFIRFYYLISAVWIGFFVYLFLLSAVYGFLVMILGRLPSMLGEIMIAGVFIASGYGVLHARTIRIKEMEISLPNLPLKWRGRKAVWVSDLHLGQIHGPAFARRIVEEVNARPHDIIFIGGDLYDGTMAPGMVSELTAPLKALAAPLGIYFVTGNHEEFGDDSVFLSAVRSVGIKPLIDEVVEIDGLQIIGVDYRNNSRRTNFKKTISSLAIQPDKPSILLKHEPKDIAVAREAGISFQISGHTHQAQMWPLGYLAQLVYKGFAFGLKRSGKMQVYTSSGTGTWGPPMRVGTDCEVVFFTFV